MRWFRRSYLMVLPLFAATALWWSCASSPDISPLSVSHLNLTALRDSIIATIPPDSEFYAFDGDEQYVKTSLLGKTFGVIEPHKNAHIESLSHRKFLAVIHVDHNYRGLKAGVPNYWVVVDISATGTGQFVGVWAVAGQPLVLRKLTPTTPPHPHPHTRARWQNQSAAVPWATCSPTMCCCEGSTCNDLKAWSF